MNIKNVGIFLIALTPQLLWANDVASNGGALMYMFYFVFFVFMFIVLPIAFITFLVKSILAFLEKHTPPKEAAER